MARTTTAARTRGGAAPAPAQADRGAPAQAEAAVSIGPRYSSLADELKADISAGQYEVGAKLPTEFDLCHRFGVSRSTVRQALAELESAGLVKRRQGSGTTVVSREPTLRYSLSIATEEDILRFASETVLDLSEFAAPVSSADSRRLRLGAASEWRVWRGLRRTTAGGPPLGIVAVYLPAIYVDTMKTLEKRSRRAIFDYIASAHGLVITAIEQGISATVVDADEAMVLQAAEGAPALSIVRRFVGPQRLMEVSETVYPADRFSYEIRLEREHSTRLAR